MKIKSSFLVVMLMVAGAAFANDPGNTQMVVLNVKETSILKVIYKSEVVENVRVNIYDQNTNVIYSETVRVQKGFILPINMGGLKAGEYTIEVAGKNSLQSKKVNYSEVEETESASIVANAIVKPSSTLNVHVAKLTDNNKYIMSIKNSGTQKISVKIFDGADTLVYHETRVINGDNGLVYNLKEVIGTPTFEVKESNGATKTIKK